MGAAWGALEVSICQAVGHGMQGAVARRREWPNGRELRGSIGCLLSLGPADSWPSRTHASVIALLHEEWIDKSKETLGKKKGRNEDKTKNAQTRTLQAKRAQHPID